jgi:GNAT superfamily N-acetyltransferase
MPTEPRPDDAEPALRALAWTRAGRASICDLIMPWEYGTVLRASRYHSYYNLNLVRVEGTPEIGVQELIAFADRSLDGLGHRLIEFESEPTGHALRAGFEAAGFRTTVLVWMNHAGPREPAPRGEVVEVPYDDVEPLRRAWHEEDFPGSAATEYHAHQREVSLARGSRVLAVMDRSEPIGFAALDRIGEATEVAAVYVLPERRGGGHGTALTRAAIAAAVPTDDLWICADAEDRPQHLYTRLGFRPVLRTIEFLLAPELTPAGDSRPDGGQPELIPARDAR